MRLFVLVPLLLLPCVVACKSREEKLKAAEEAARLAADTKARAVKGVGESLQTEGKTGAESITKGLGAVVKGATKGFDAGVNEVKIAVAPSLGSKGIQSTRASLKNQTVAVYVIFDQSYQGTMVLRALDSKNAEIGRSVMQMNETAGSARYVEFPFDSNTPMAAIGSYELR